MSKAVVKIQFSDGTRLDMEMDKAEVGSYQRMDVKHPSGTKKVRRVKIDDGVFYFKEEKVIEGNIP